MNISENALKVLERRYFQKNENGECIENWQDMVLRVASNIAGGDKEKTQRYINLLDSGYFLPNSPTLMNAGNDLQQLSACFVLPVEDSIEGIFESVKNAALIHKSGGGTGFSFSRLREQNARVRSTNGVSSGPISFLSVFNAATDAVKQGGTRRGANMAILNVDHPDILEFITCKEDINNLTNFNISVGITEEFMQAVHDDQEYPLVSPHSGEITQKIKATEVFNLIVEMAHKNGEPGIVFIDRINDYNPTPQVGAMESTNPCGEQPLLPNEACNLGSMNLALLWEDNEFNWDRLQQVVYDSVDFLDDVINRSQFPLQAIDYTVKQNRKIGLGVMGWADLLYEMKIPYNSDEATLLAAKLMEFIDYHSKLKSIKLAEQQGSFPNFKGSIYSQGTLHRKGELDWDMLRNDISSKGIRNATTTTIAPTGTISMIANTSSGVEPQFSLVYVKNVMDGEKLLYVNPHFEKAMHDAGLYSEEMMIKVAETGSIQEMSKIPAEIREVFVTSHDITPEWHIRMQAAFQKFVDNAVSKTINFTNEASVEDIRISYELAHELGCKGVTVYRDGSRQNQVLNVGSSIKEDKEVPCTQLKPRQRPEFTQGMTRKIETGCGHLYVTINYDSEGPFELFTTMGKVGGCASAQLEAIARLVSLCLRSNIDSDEIARQLKAIRCPSPMWNKGEMVTSCADAIARSLEKFSQIEPVNIAGMESNTQTTAKPRPRKKMSGTCPECGSTIQHVEGCLTCPNCGWSKC
ncbi:MAG: vitamin B12-dependent ribonucleotide reductase [Candidatus Stygibacter australis]|nr:vitamin B12-dependent ribonucleotide reductase [Candidatus Stygibacter australis]